MHAFADFLPAILECPEDDAPRLVLADWLDENGQEARAEFIRVQVELARRACNCRLPEDRACLDCGFLCRREADLLDSLAHTWVPALDGITVDWASFVRRGADAVFPVGLDNYTFTFTRGFVERVELTCAVWVKHGPAILAAHPVATVKLWDKVPRRRGWALSDDPNCPPWCLPDCMGTRLRPRAPQWTYASDEAALEALSNACLDYAREPWTTSSDA